jgi:hypothetical protein
MRRAGALLAVAMALGAGRADATALAGFFVGETLVGTDLTTGGSVALWLERGGRYAALFDRGQAVRAGGARGPFRYEGREGAYQVTVATVGVQLCLRPDPDPYPRGQGVGVALFFDSICMILPVRPIGEAFALDFGGHRYRMVMVEGEVGAGAVVPNEASPPLDAPPPGR